jgi:hypothetical protein
VVRTRFFSLRFRFLVGLPLLLLMGMQCQHSWEKFWDVSENSTATALGPCTACRVFVTASVYVGNLGGPTGADAKCNADANRPTLRSYKAMLADGTTRVACLTNNNCTNPGENVGWVLKRNTTYYLANGVTILWTTNAAGIYDYSIAPPAIGTGTIWTGFQTAWVTANHCSAWTDSSGSSTGQIGDASTLANTQLNAGANPSCNGVNTNKLYCVEQ